MKLYTERNINEQLRPMINARGRSFSDPYIAEFYMTSYPEFKAPSDVRWDLNCYKLIDFLTTSIKLIFDKGFGEVSSPYDEKLSGNKLLNDPRLVHAIKNELEGGISITSSIYKNIFIDVSMKRIGRSSIFKNVSNHVIHETILKASSFRLNIPYKFYSKKEDGNYGFVKFRFEGFDKFFNVIIIDGPEGKDGKLYHKRYRFTFDTVLGTLFVHNILCSGWSRLDDNFRDDFYNLSRYANILFRMRFLPFNEKPLITLKMDEVLASLGITSTNNHIRKKKFFDLINELRDSNFIDIVSIKDNVVEATRSTHKKKQKKIIPITRNSAL